MAAAPIDRAVFYARLRASKLLGPTISDVEFAGLQGILAAWEEQGWPADLRFVAYTMATAWHEARLNAGIREIGKGAGYSYGKPAGPYGLIYYGRGPSQLTWYDNYVKFGRLLSLDLARNPDLALVPEIGAAILIIGSRDGLFRAGKTLAKFFNERTDNPVGARDIINGDVTKNGGRIAGYHNTFLACLNAAMLPAGSPVPTPPVETKPLAPPPGNSSSPAPLPSMASPTNPVVVTGGLWSALKSMFTKKGTA